MLTQDDSVKLHQNDQIHQMRRRLMRMVQLVQKDIGVPISLVFPFEIL